MDVATLAQKMNEPSADNFNFYMHCSKCDYKCKKKREMKYHQTKEHSAFGTDYRNIQFPEKDENGKFPCPIYDKRFSAPKKNVIRHVKEGHLGILGVISLPPVTISVPD